ncbi:MAG: hypothetical protein JW929_08045 [Anaerolineales bacterium]|nr:hypothetical protein [Anaerolineales bacterium]
MDIVGLIIALVSGAVGGNVAGALMKDKNLGLLWNSVAGIVGGGLGGWLLNLIVPGLAGGGGLDIGSILGQIASGGVGGGIIMVVVALIKQAIKK